MLVFYELHGVLALVGDDGLYEVAGGAVGDAEGGLEMEACGIGVAELHVAQHGLLEEVGWHLAGILLFAEVAGIELARALEHADVHDIVVIDVLDLDAIVVVGARGDLVFRGVDGNIPMIAVTTIHNYRVRFDLLGIAEDMGRIMDKLGLVSRIVTLLELHHITILITKPEEMR